MSTILVSLAIVALILNILLLSWIFEIAKNSRIQTNELKKHTLLLAEIAEKNGVLDSVIKEIKSN
jgi:hypothetical protein